MSEKQNLLGNGIFSLPLHFRLNPLFYKLIINLQACFQDQKSKGAYFLVFEYEKIKNQRT
jgi:hypothetical protein